MDGDGILPAGERLLVPSRPAVGENEAGGASELRGTVSGGRVGTLLTMGGDHDGDGTPELLVGAPTEVARVSLPTPKLPPLA